MSALDAVILNEIKKLAAAAASGGGGGGVPINSSMALNVGAVNMYTEEGQVWLKTGVISPDVATYPDAYSLVREISRVLLSDTSTYKALTTDGTYIYAMESTSNLIKKFTPELVFQSSISSGTTSGNKNNLCWVPETNSFNVGLNNSTFLVGVTTAGVLTGSNITFPANLWRVTYKDGFYYGVYSDSQGIVRQFNPDGTVTGVTATTPLANIYGITADSGHIYVSDRRGVMRYKYLIGTLSDAGEDMRGDFTNDIHAYCILNGKTYLCTSTALLECQPTVGESIAKFEPVKFSASITATTEFGNPLYTRIL